MSIDVRISHWNDSPAGIRQIREAVFINEQAVPEELEWDEHDADADHFLAKIDGVAAGVARLYATGAGHARIGRMAVLPNFRHRGVGAALLDACLQRTVARQLPQAELSAQVAAVPFYQRYGFHVCSEAYQDAGIAHQDMRLTCPELALRLKTTQQGPLLVLGQDTASHFFASLESATQLAQALILQGKHSLDLYSFDLEPALYHTPALAEAISHLARYSRFSHVRMIVRDIRRLISQRHDLVELAKRIPTRVEIRHANAEFPLLDDAFLIVDDHGLLYRNDHQRYEGFANFDSAPRVRQMRERFVEMWEHAVPSAELRELGI